MPEVTISENIKISQLQEFHDSGVSAFFRVLSNNLNQQNMLADNKANIMISINTVVLSLVIGSSARNIEYWNDLFVPIIMLVLTCLLTTVFAVLATRPNFKKGTISQDDVKNKKSTLLFFGNFTSLSAQDFENSMLTILKDDEYLYRSLLADFYGQGNVLKRKYILLKYSYTVFLFGLVCTIIMFGIYLYIK